MSDSGGSYSRIHNWANDKLAAIKILASRMDAEDNSIATALNNRIFKDGTDTGPTANLPMNAKKHTGVANGTNADDYAAVNQLQTNTSAYVATDTGSADAYVIGPSPAITTLTAGLELNWVAANSNTGASTVNVSALGVNDLKVNGTLALEAGDIVAGMIYKIIYDGTDFQLMNPSAARYV